MRKRMGTCERIFFGGRGWRRVYLYTRIHRIEFQCFFLDDISLNLGRKKVDRRDLGDIRVKSLPCISMAS